MGQSYTMIVLHNGSWAKWGSQAGAYINKRNWPNVMPRVTNVLSKWSRIKLDQADNAWRGNYI
jgi:hypothetical protein